MNEAEEGDRYADRCEELSGMVDWGRVRSGSRSHEAGFVAERAAQLHKLSAAGEDSVARKHSNRWLQAY